MSSSKWRPFSEPMQEYCWLDPWEQTYDVRCVMMWCDVVWGDVTVAVDADMKSQ